MFNRRRPPNTDYFRRRIYNPNDIFIDYSKRLGCGAFSQGVYKGRIIGSDEVRAFKLLESTNPEEFHYIKKEINIMLEIALKNVPYTVKLIGYLLNENADKLSCALGMSLAEKGSLEDIYGLTWSQQTIIMYGITTAIYHLHEMLSILHADIKLENILLNNDYTPMLADFGCSNKIIDASNHANFTHGYAAPELLLDNPSPNSKETDMYALCVTLAITLWKYFTSEIADVAEIKILLQEPDQELIPKNHVCPKNIAALITLGLNQRPNERPTAQELLEPLSHHFNII